MFLPGSPGTAELPTCSTTAPGTAEATSRATPRATSGAAGSHGWNAAGSRSYGRIGRSDIEAKCRAGHRRIGGSRPVAMASPAPYDRDPRRRSVMRIVTGRRVTEVDVG